MAPEVKREPETERANMRNTEGKRPTGRWGRGTEREREGERQTARHINRKRRKDSERDVGPKKERQANVSRPS